VTIFGTATTRAVFCASEGVLGRGGEVGQPTDFTSTKKIRLTSTEWHPTCSGVEAMNLDAPARTGGVGRNDG
jgi:hypothetical protein